LVGEGYGDGQLRYSCEECNVQINQDILRVTKFRDDIRNLITKNWALPGTILNIETGIPKQVAAGDDQLFPSRLAPRALLVGVAELVDGKGSASPNMGAVRDMIEKVTGRFADSSELKHVEGKQGIKTAAPTQLSLGSRKQTRRMMARYWQNPSPFGLDLSGAILRQGLFTEKMCKVCLFGAMD
jgi:hypothetical protein